MRGEPLPPLLEIPAPVRDLTAQQVGDHVDLRWSPIQRTTEATLVRELDRIEIYHLNGPQSASTIDFGASAPSQTFRGHVLEDDGALLILMAGSPVPLTSSDVGRIASFAIKAVNRRGKDGGFSNIAAVEIVDLPEPPANLEATLTEPAIELRWKPAERSIFGGAAPTPDGYEVYRADAGSPSPAQLLGTATSPSYEDRSFAFGSRYVYSVRAFAKRGDSTARTPESNRVEIAAIDTFPPAAPQQVSAIAVPGAVELAWSPNGEADLAGYNVYRGDRESLIRLNPDLITLPLYRDTTAKAGSAYRYVVKAVDQSGNEGPASAEATATAE